MKTLLLLWKAFDYSLQDLRNIFFDEIAFRIEIAVTVILIPSALLLPVWLIVYDLRVLIIELINTAVKAAVSRISTEQHTLSAKAKDAGSAGVLMASINLVVVWG